MSENRITPGGFEPGELPSPPPEGETLHEKAEKPYFALTLVITLGLAALVLVFFPWQPDSDSILPEETSSEVALTSNENAPPEVVAPPTPNTPVASPWADSIEQQARADSQDILAKLLSVLQQLEQLRVNDWEKSAFYELQTLAASGDQTYQERNYDDAIDLYNKALTQAEELLSSASGRAPNYLEQGINALEQNQVEPAIYNLELATLLDPNLEPAKKILLQAEVRESVLQLNSSAEKLLREGELERAKEAYLEIQKLDSEYENLAATIDKVNDQIAEKRYRTAMSKGFKDLADGKLAAAEIAFEQAGAIRPNNNSVEEALQQVEAARINNQRQTKLDRAIAFEASENWSEALQLYVALLAEDPTITSAQLGKIRSEARAELNADIQAILSEPLKLQDEQRWQAANTVLAEAKNVIDRGPTLSKQIEQLDTAVRRARTKITVALYSDSETNVEIYRMGTLGQFREHAVALYPGRYVLVGTRSGYRDVREDLVLDGTQPRIELNIECREAI